MTTNHTIEERLSTLERELADIKCRLDHDNEPRDWLDKISGSMQRFPEFEDVIRLGRELRQSQSDPNS